MTELGQPTAEAMATVRDLYGKGQYLQAYQLVQPFAPLQEWTDVDAQVLGGRLAHNLGSSRLARILHRRAHRQSPQHAEAAYFYVLSVKQRRGPWETWTKLREVGDLEGADPMVQADWFAVHAHILALLRDFQEAEHWFARAEELAPERAWIWVERALIYEIEDRMDDALEACKKAMSLRPYYRPAVQMLGHRLVQMNKDDEAIQLLEDACQQLESADIRSQLAAFLIEKETNYERAQELLDEAEQMLPLMDPLRQRWMAARKADLHYYRGQREAARDEAQQVKTAFYDKFAERLAEDADQHCRKRLEVDFVKQHHLTCAPATLTAICDYWNKDVEHSEVADAICYDGTPGHKERLWAEENGFVTREFLVTEDVARKLIDHGMPFSLTTVNPGSSHLQAVIGYDTSRGTLLVRDPNERHFSEFDLEEMLKHYGSSGPRGMVMTPQSEAHRLEGIDFPDGELYDLYYQLERCLKAFDREEAGKLHEQMVRLAPQGRVTLQAMQTLAKYDHDHYSLKSCADQLLEAYPDDVNLMVLRLQLLRENGTRQRRLELLEELYSDADCDPLFWAQYAFELRDDAQRYDEAATLLLRAMRFRPHDGRAYGMLAEIRMDQRRREEALLLHRFAASLDDTDENRSRHYFYNSRLQNKTKEAILFLEDRFRRFGSRSSAPARTLAWAYDELDKTSKSFELLEEAIKKRPDDGDFKLYLADMYGRYGKHDRARELLEEAKPHSHPTMQLRTAAMLANYRGDLPQALEHWQEVLESDPFDGDAHDHVARLLADLRGEHTAVEHLEAAVEANPHSYPLRVRLIEWLRSGDDSQKYEDQLRQLTRMHDDSWGRRELAVAMIKLNRLEDAAQEIENAQRLEPESPVVHYLWGYLHQRQGKLSEAREAFRESLRKSVDYDLAISGLMEACDTKAHRVEALKFVYQQLQDQVILGDGLLAYREYAESTLDSEALLQELKEALQQRPDLWHVHSALVAQLTEMNRLAEALEVASAAARRFPLLPRVWLDLALIRHARTEYDEEITALKSALKINSNWSDASRQLADAHQARGELEQACNVLQKAINREPRDVRNLARLSDIMWQQGRRDTAIEQLKVVVRMEPGFEYAWIRLRQWFAEIDNPAGPIQVAHELTEARPAEARSWLVLAECCEAAGDHQGAVDAINRLLQLNPLHVQARDLGAHSLCRLGRFDEALAMVHPPEYQDRMPLKLLGAEAETHMSAGNSARAFELMRHVVQQDPDAAWAWFRLAEWYDGVSHQLARYREACENLIRIAPHAAVSWGYYADGCMRAGDRDDAKRAYRKAVDLDGEYIYASRQLFEMLIEDEQYDEAADLLSEVVHHWPEDFGLAEQVRIEALLGNREQAARLFGILIELAQVDEDAVDIGIGAMVSIDMGDAAERMLCQQVTSGVAAESIGTCWVQLCDFNETLHTVAGVLDSEVPQDEVFGAAAAQYLRFLNRLDMYDEAVEFINAHRQRIDLHPRAWSGAVYALHESGRPQEAMQWLRGWQDRTGLTCECLLLPMMALRRGGHDEQAAEMSKYALELPADIASATHVVSLALNRILDGSPDDVREAYAMIAGIQEDHVTEFGKIVLQFLLAIEPGMLGQGEYNAAALRLKTVGTEHKEFIQNDQLVKQIYRQLRVRLAKAHDKKFMAWWAKMSN